MEGWDGGISEIILKNEKIISDANVWEFAANVCKHMSIRYSA